LEVPNITQRLTVSVIGCGWLGFPLASKLVNDGYRVRGTTTREPKLSLLEKAGIDPVLLELDPSLSGSRIDLIFESDLVIMLVPPAARRNGELFHAAQVKSVVDRLSVRTRSTFIYISSTSVYGNSENEWKEEAVSSVTNSASKTMGLAEEEARKYGGIWHIIRMGGLMGYDRVPCRYIRPESDQENRVVNYVHRDDAVQAIIQIASCELRKETWNVVAPEHPTRKAVIHSCQDQYALDTSTLEWRMPNGIKRVSAEKLQKELQFRFQFPDPLKFYYE